MVGYMDPWMTILKIMRTGFDPSPSSSPKLKNWLFHEVIWESSKTRNKRFCETKISLEAWNWRFLIFKLKRPKPDVYCFLWILASWRQKKSQCVCQRYKGLFFGERNSPKSPRYEDFFFLKLPYLNNRL